MTVTLIVPATELLTNEYGTALTTIQDVPSISVAAYIIFPVDVLTVETLLASVDAEVLSEENT